MSASNNSGGSGVGLGVKVNSPFLVVYDIEVDQLIARLNQLSSAFVNVRRSKTNRI